METTFKTTNNSGMYGAKIGTNTFAGSKETVEAVQLDLERSTSTARAMNLAMKILAMDWTDRTIDRVEEMIDERLLELANGKDWKVEVSFTRPGEVVQGIHTDRFWVRALNVKRAIELAEESITGRRTGWLNHKVEKVFVIEGGVETKVIG